MLHYGKFIFWINKVPKAKFTTSTKKCATCSYRNVWREILRNQADTLRDRKAWIHMDATCWYYTKSWNNIPQPSSNLHTIHLIQHAPRRLVTIIILYNISQPPQLIHLNNFSQQFKPQSFPQLYIWYLLILFAYCVCLKYSTLRPYTLTCNL